MSREGQVIADHREWLKGFDPQYLKLWNDEYAALPESALCEACVRDVIQGFGFTVEPWADLRGMPGKGAEKRPDYRCTKGADSFYIEVANIPIDKATEHTGLAHPPDDKPRSYDKLAKAVVAKASKKTTQCDQDLPTLLAVGTFHCAASAICMDQHCAEYLLSGEQLITWKVNTTTGKSFGPTYLGTKFKDASFLRAKEDSIFHVRTSISGILLCGFGVKPASVLGVLHPNADRSFNPALLPRIPFAYMRLDIPAGYSTIAWANDDQEPYSLAHVK